MDQHYDNLNAESSQLGNEISLQIPTTADTAISSLITTTTRLNQEDSIPLSPTGVCQVTFAIDDFQKTPSRLLILLLADEKSAEKASIIHALKKMNRSRFIVLNPEILGDSFRKRSEFSEDIKKGKDIPNETLLKMLITKINEPSEHETRKEKKRDNMKSQKTVAVEDYPPDGPDLYYLLSDFPKSIHDIQSLKDHSVTLDLILNLKTASFSSSLAEEVKATTEKRTEPALMDSIVKDIEIGNRDIKEVTEEIVQNCYQVVSLKQTYQEWNRKVSLVKLPSPSNFWGASQGTGYKIYDEFLQGIPESALSVPIIVHAMLKQVSGKSVLRNSHDENQPDLPSYFNKAYSKLIGSDITSPAPQISEAPQEPSISLCSEFDATAIRAFGVSIDSGSLDTLERNLLYSIKTPGEHAAATSDEHLEEIEEAMIERREFYSHANQYPPHQIDHCMILFEFEDMIGEYLENVFNEQKKKEREEKRRKAVEQARAHGTLVKKPQEEEEEDPPEIFLDDRVFVEELSKGAISHILQTMEGRGHRVLTQYYPYLDAQLVVYLTEVPPERISKPQIVESKVPSKTCFGKWMAYHAKQDTEGAFHGTVYDVTEDQGSTHLKSTYMYPNDGSLIQVSQWNAGRSTEHSTLLHHSRSVFGLSSKWDGDKKASSSFGIDLPDNILLTVFNESEPHVCVAIPQGLSVLFSFKDGTLSQFYKTSHEASKPNTSNPGTQPRAVIGGSPLLEHSRTVTKNGVLIRFMEDGSKEIVHPDGKTELVKPYGDRIITLPDGRRSKIMADGTETPLTSIGVARKTDPETNKVDITREDMVFSIEYPDGTTSLHIPDGSIITRNNQSVILESPFYTTVQVFPDHTQVILEGGSLIANSDHLIFTSSLGSSVNIHQSGKVQVYPDLIKKAGQSIQADVDWIKGSFEYSDNKGCIFAVLPDGSCSVQLKQEEPSRQVSNPEVDSEAEEEDTEEEPSPMVEAMTSHPPRLFVRKPDGTAYELLRAEDVIPFLTSHKALSEKEPSRVWYRCEPIEEGSQCFTVVKKARQVQGSVLMAYRQIYQHKPMTKEDQDQLNDALEIFHKKKDAEEDSSQEDSHERTQEELLQEKAVLERISTYQKSKDKSLKDKEAQMLKEYIDTRKSDQDLLQETPKERMAETKKGPPKKTRPDAEKVKQQLDTIKHELTPSTLSYFETEEGTSFLQSKPAPIKKPTSLPPASKPTLQTPPDTPPLSPSQRVTSSSPRVQTSKSGQGSVTPKKKIELATTGTPSRGERANSPMKTDVLGKERKSPPQIPKTFHFQSGTPNTKYIEMESPVKRKLHTSSMKNGGMQTQMFIIYPSTLNMGTLQQGITYKIAYSLTNSGVDVGRYLVKGPPHKDIHCTYVPGLVAPGMKVNLEVIVKASEVGTLSQEVIVETPAEIFKLPLTAVVLPPDQSAAPTKGVKPVS